MKHLPILIVSSLIIGGCATNTAQPAKRQIVEIAPTAVVKKANTTKVIKPSRHVAQRPRKAIVLKKIDDSNYNEAYMYPEDGKAAKKDIKEKNTPIASQSTPSVMSKIECIAMISQEKFDKYTAMFGSEDASIKRCAMIKRMQK